MDSQQPRRSQGWLRLTSFASAEGSPAKLIVSLEADLLDGHRPPKDLCLLARREGMITCHRPIASELERIAGSRLNRRSQVFHWRASFEVPAAVARDPRVSFEMVTEPHAVLDPEALGGERGDSEPLFERPTSRTGACLTVAAALLAGLAPTGQFRLGPEPLPALELPPLGWQTHEPRPIYERPTPRIGVFLASAAALLAGLAPGFALADGGSGSTTTSTTTSTAITQTANQDTSSTTTSTPAVTTTSSQPPATTSKAPPNTTTQTTPTKTQTAPAPVATTTTTSTSSTTPTTTSTPPRRKGKPSRSGGGSTKHRTHHRLSHPATHGHHRGSSHHRGGHAPTRHTGGAAPAPRHGRQGLHPSPVSPAAAGAPPAAGTSFSAPVLTDLLSPAELRTYTVLVGGMVEPPAFLQRIYRAAAHKYGMPWQVLAAINYVETRYGKDLAVSSAGAIGWMQFMPSTWSEYGESVNLKGKPIAGAPNPWDPTDAIFAAARYLKAAGAGRNLPGAVYAYNHAGWYVQEVLSIAEEINRHNMWPQRHASRKVAAMLAMARLLNGLPYIWGGGHSNFTMVQPGYDCSGFVSAVLHAGGYLDGPNTTQTLPSQPLIEPGRGRYVTIRDRTYLSADQDHVIIDINGQWWESGGWGVQSDRIHRMRNVTRAYLDSFNLVLHPRGL